MSKVGKDTIYIEADDEITSVIDRVVDAQHKVVALVLPKRAPVFQSVVNMKLLKKAAEQAKKSLVIISSEEVIESIAAVAGVYLAKTLNSKPVLPTRARKDASETTIAADELEGAKQAPASEQLTSSAASAVPVSKPVGAAALAGATASSGSSLEDDVITMENADEDVTANVSIASQSKNAADTAKKPKFKIPDFSRFQLKLGLSVLVLVLLMAGWVYGFMIAPRATITIEAKTSRTSVAYQFTASADVTELNKENKIVPAKVVEVTKENTAKVPATGEKNIGEKAVGTVAVTAKNCVSLSKPSDLSAGTTITSNGKNFITQAVVSFSFDSFDGSCLKYEGDSVAVIAAESGESYNLAPNSTFTVSGRSDVTITGSATGGTSQIVKVVSAQDIQIATSQLKTSSSVEARTELEKQLSDQSLRALTETFEEGTPAVKNNPAEGAEANEVTVTQTVTYHMLGISNDNLNALLNDALAKQLEAANNTKNVRNNGFESAKLRLITKTSKTQQILELQTIASLGEQFNTETIQKDAAGKKRGEIESMLESRESVQSVEVRYSPSWITTTPKSPDKITVTIKEVEG